MNPSDALTRGTPEWWRAWCFEQRDRERSLAALGHDEQRTIIRPDESEETITVRVGGATTKQWAAERARTQEAWKARVEHGLANGEFQPPGQSAWERTRYGSGTSPWSRYALIHIAAFWGGIFAVGGLAYLVGGTAAGLVAAAIVGTSVAIGLGKRNLSLLCLFSSTGIAGYVFGPKQYVNPKTRALTPSLEEERFALHTHWIGASLALAGALVLIGLAALVQDRRGGTTIWFFRPGWKARFRRVGRLVAWLVALLAAALSLLGEEWAAIPVTFAVGWLLVYGLATLLPFVGPALFESISARPPVVRRRKAFFKDLYENVRWPPDM